MELKKKNFIELNNDIYCLDDVKCITYNTNNKKYEVYFEYITISISEDEYKFIKEHLKKLSNSFNIF